MGGIANVVGGLEDSQLVWRSINGHGFGGIGPPDPGGVKYQVVVTGDVFGLSSFMKTAVSNPATMIPMPSISSQV